MEKLNIGNVPTVVYGERSDKVYLFVHGKCGCKEEAQDFYRIAGKKGCQVIAIDLPCHGERKSETDTFDPFHAVPELCSVMEYIKGRWKNISLRANSIGAYFSMLAFSDFAFDNVLFVSPLLDMEKLICNMMTWANVTEEELESKKIIPTQFGETLSWDYYVYAKEHRITHWNSPTHILYAGRDNLTSRETVDEFVKDFGCTLDVMENGEHWFHTEEQLRVLDSFTEKYV